VRPDTSYALDGDVHIAYQVLGTGSRDLLLVPEFWHSIEAQWESPELATFLDRLAGLGRLICFDQRGSGLSDPIALDEVPGLELWLNDIRVVLEAVGSERATLIAFGGGVPTSILYAAANPQRVPALVLVNGYATVTRALDYAYGLDEAARHDIRDVMTAAWGRGAFLDRLAPSRLDDEDFRRWWARSQRLGASPGSVVAQFRVLEGTDVREVLPSIQAPTLVVAREENTWIRAEHGRFLADHIPGAAYVGAPGRDYFPFIGDSEVVLSAIEQFVRSTADVAQDTDRILATLLFTDIVGSTSKAAELGDRAWADLAERHHELVRLCVEDAGGRVVDTAGDGMLAVLDGPARAIRCALAIRDGLRPLGLEIRVGVHTGEVELVGTSVRGVAVATAARIMAEAGRGDVYVSGTVRDLTAGSGIELVDAGLFALKGVPGEWQLFSVAGLT
jgi:class 3 adenylate cyclase/pimeloyl-ACP methyl ester carboxylesterase